MLADLIAEWNTTIKEARHELKAVELARRQGQPGAKPTVTENEAGLELDLAKLDLADLKEAQQLLRKRRRRAPLRCGPLPAGRMPSRARRRGSAKCG